MAEKEYVLGNKTKDLLVYTFLVTKPISEKTLDISDAIREVRTISSLSENERALYSQNLIEDLEKRSKKEGFPKSAVHTYAKVIRETAVSIVRNIHAANDCSFQTEYKRRLELIHYALNDCNLLLKMVEISHELGYISLKRMAYWTKMITDVKYMTLAWKKKDSERAREIERKVRTADYRLHASIVAEAVAAAIAKSTNR